MNDDLDLFNVFSNERFIEEDILPEDSMLPLKGEAAASFAKLAPNKQALMMQAVLTSEKKRMALKRDDEHRGG